MPVAQSNVALNGDSAFKRTGVLGNSFWYGVQMFMEVAGGAILSILVARVMGPERLGYFIYFSFLTSIANRFSGLGTGDAARKYITEFLARNELGMARAVFFITLRLQAMLAFAVAGFGIALSLLFVSPDFRPTACILVLSIIPGLLISVPSSTNMAAGRFSRNVPSALAGLLVYAATIGLTLVLGWGLVGLACAMLLRRTLELVLRLVPAVGWIRSMPKQQSPKEFYRKLMNFSGNALAISIVLFVVNDRSEVLFLKHFCNIKQVAFYSIAFSLGEYLLMVPQVFGSAMSSAFMADYSKDPVRAGNRLGTSICCLALLVLPAHLGLAVISKAFVSITYGPSYGPAIVVLTVAALLAIPKAFFWIPNVVYQAAEQQGVMLRRLVVAAVMNVALDALLIPRFGAMGAAFGNGLSQTFTVLILWGPSARLGHVQIQWSRILRVLAAAMGMSVTVALICALFGPRVAMLAGILAGIGTYLMLLRIVRALQVEDAERILGMVAKSAPITRRLLALFLYGRRRATANP